MATSDRGSNEVLGRKIILSETQSVDNCLFMDCDCLEHAPHLIVASSLLFADDLLQTYGKCWRYWRSLAIFANTAREVAGALYGSYCQNFGPLAGRSVKAIFPKPMSQRWNRISELENRMLRAGFYELAVCLADVLANKFIDSSELDLLARATTDETVQTGWEALKKIREAVHVLKKHNNLTKAKVTSDIEKRVTPNSLEIEQTKAYTICMSQWRGQTLRNAADVLWGKMVKAMNLTREPLMHLSFFLKKASTSKDDDFGPLAHLVFGKAAGILQEYNTLLRHLVSLLCVYVLNNQPTTTYINKSGLCLPRSIRKQMKCSLEF